ncbi:maltotransferase domain-containing protein [Calditrichota bacterium]
MIRGVKGRKRVRIENIAPVVDSGRYAVKRIIGEPVEVGADIFADGHDQLAADLLYRRQGGRRWREVRMTEAFNSRWQASFTPDSTGFYQLNIVAWVDEFRSWLQGFKKKVEAQQYVKVDLMIGLDILKYTMTRCENRYRAAISQWVKRLDAAPDLEASIVLILDDELSELMHLRGLRKQTSELDKPLPLLVEPLHARFSSWYEMFPRSASEQEGVHANFQDVEHRLPYISHMGFDVVYFPPIHPISQVLRKGPNNTLVAGPGDPGSPWAIGSREGGHKSIHTDLGTFGDFRHLIERAREFNLHIAIDVAFQVSPEHPYIEQHPEWFRMRPDGTIQYAENPPKKYQDIYPFDFDTKDWRELWDELFSVFIFWIEQGVEIFRVDNPHTKPFAFWEWCIGEIKKQYPDVLFLAEAFTMPRIMQHLAKIGFSQSYTYFPWKNNRAELIEFINEFTTEEVRQYMYCNHWTNTPDILNAYLQQGGRTPFMTRLILASTLGANYGIYGPAFELCVSQPIHEGSEEYLDSEKYQLRHWDLDSPDSIRDLVTLMNRLRKENPALQSDDSIQFHFVNNENLICYSKCSADMSNVIVMIVNVDTQNIHAGTVTLDLSKLGLSRGESYTVHDLLTDAKYGWTGANNYVELDPHKIPAHVLRIEK